MSATFLLVLVLGLNESNSQIQCQNAVGQSKIMFTPSENENKEQIDDPNKEKSKVQTTIGSLYCEG